MRWCRHEQGKVSTLTDHENAWTEEGTDVERPIYFYYITISSLPVVLVLAIGISFFSTAAGYSVLLLFLVRPVTNLYARRRLS
jgi:hypothetical protein